MNAPNFNILRAVEAARGSSELVKGVAGAKSAFHLLSAAASSLKKGGFKPLSPVQIRALKAQGNRAEDWKKVRVGAGFDAARVVGCQFAGPVLLSGFSGSVEVDGVALPTGLSNSTLSSCVIGKNALIRNVRLLNRSVVGEGAVLFDVGTLTAGAGGSAATRPGEAGGPSGAASASGSRAAAGEGEAFANGLLCLIAVETGGREIQLFAELTVEGAWVLSRSRGDRVLLESYAKGVESYRKAVTSPCNVIGPSSRILHTPRVSGIFLGAGGVIDGAAFVSDATVLSSAGEPSRICEGAIVKSSILQWGCEAASGAIVDSSLLTEHSHVERHGKVTHSILGPNTGVAEGEVTSALLGPFVGFHHQSLLIAALWPEGKGNVAYGANIGSNHTAKAPDQEIWPGEGTFFGLGVNVKFPTDLTRSPYSIIASCVNMLPQRVEFPFSLINTPAAALPGISPAYNELIPAWVLSDNIYMVKRNEGKYMKRNKAKRSRFEFEVFRPEIVDLMLDARRRLEVPQTKEVYTSKEIRGLGKNYLLEPSRSKGVETYTFYVRYYALLGLKRELEIGGASGSVDGAQSLLKAKSASPRWEHERRVLLEEFPQGTLPELLKELIRMQERIARDVQTSKEKDDRRGAEVIEDYADAHKPAAEDSFVKETRAATEKLKKEVESLLLQLQKAPAPTAK
ncbi:MAG: DUF4954 family protein [Candidatus Omnitrophica bacterium]|nr:DUF4954 family protein [Candidatus Omnitrophota bacterium]